MSNDEKDEWQEPWEPGDPVTDSPLPENTEEWELEEGVGEEPLSPDDVDEILGDAEGLDDVLREVDETRRGGEQDSTAAERARRLLKGEPPKGRNSRGPGRRLWFERLEGRQGGNEQDEGEIFS